MANDRALGRELPRLAEELIVEILVKLPVVSLLRFRCVCRSWYDLIESPDFIQRHREHNYTKTGSILVIRGLGNGVFVMSLNSYESLDLISSEKVEIPDLGRVRLKVCEPCNGWFCIADCDGNIVLFNPASGEFRVPPPRKFPYRKRWVEFDGIGFGFDSVTNSHKVVSFVRLRRKDEREQADEYGEDCDDDEYAAYNTAKRVGIYDLSTDSWRQIEHAYHLTTKDAPVYSAPFQGALHWIAWSQRKGCDIVICFDLSTEAFREMELPEDVVDARGSKHKFLTVLNESLALFAYEDYRSTKQFVELWVMHKYGNAKSWTKQVSIGPVTGIERPLLLWKNEAILLRSKQGRLVSYALDTHEMNDIEANLLGSKEGQPPVVPAAPDARRMDPFGINGVHGIIGLMVYRES